jgi:hypothetical protein
MSCHMSVCRAVCISIISGIHWNYSCNNKKYPEAKTGNVVRNLFFFATSLTSSGLVVILEKQRNRSCNYLEQHVHTHYYLDTEIH